MQPLLYAAQAVAELDGPCAQGSVFSALLTDMMEAVRWGASSGGSPRSSPRARTGAAPAPQQQQPPPPSMASRVLQATSIILRSFRPYQNPDTPFNPTLIQP